MVKYPNYKINVLLLIITTVLLSCKQPKKDDLHSINLKGNVESVRCIYREASEKFGKIIPGKIIGDSLVTMKFNDSGQLTDSTWNNQKSLKKIEYKNGFRAKESFYFGKALSSFKDYIYSSDGKINEITTYDKGRKIIQKRIYKYQNTSSIVKIYNSEGALIGSANLNFDDDGNLIEISRSGSRVILKYNDDLISNKTVTKKLIVEEDCNETYEHSYFSKLKYQQTITIKSDYDKEGNIKQYKYEKVNDAKTIEGGCKSYSWSDGSLDIISFTYPDYDKMKNWTIQVVKNEYGLDHLIERKIKYRKE